MTLKMVDVFSGSPRSFATQSGVDITMVKATQGTGYVNPYCDTDYQAAKKAGKLLGVYHYIGGGSPEAEAEYFYKHIKNYLGEAVPAVDWEEYQNSSWGNTNYVKRFVDKFYSLTKVYPLIYVQQSAINQVANCASTCGLWVAWYASMSWTSWTTPNASFSISPWKYMTIWQFTGGDMDRNIVYTDKAGWKKLAKGDRASAVVEKPVAPAKPAEKPNAWTDDLGHVWTKESGTFTTGCAINVRWGATPQSKLIATLPQGSVVKYDAFSRHGGYVWIRQPREGGYGYLVCREGNKPLGTFNIEKKSHSGV